jgi:hypothetical protein
VLDGRGFRFRHALTREAVLEGLLPPERGWLAGRALAAVREAYPGVPGIWCVVASELAVAAGDADSAGALLLEAGRRDLAAGALASAERALEQAQALIAEVDAGPDLRVRVEEALWAATASASTTAPGPSGAACPTPR